MSQETKVEIVEKRKMTRLQEMTDIIQRDDEVTAADLAAELDLPVNTVYSMVSYQNLKCLDNPDKYPHICHTGMGYSLTVNKENSIYESERRMKQSHGVLYRGIPAFAKCKMLAPKYFANLVVEYNPSAKQLVRLLNKA